MSVFPVGQKKGVDCIIATLPFYFQREEAKSHFTILDLVVCIDKRPVNLCP